MRTPRGTAASYNSTLDGIVNKSCALDGAIIADAPQSVHMADDSKPGPKPKVSDDEILAVFRNSADPVLSTAEVTEQLSLKRRSVYDRLSALAEDGRLEQKDIGGRNTVWWLPEE